MSTFSRSASISSAVDDTSAPLLKSKTSLGAKTSTLRSASIGSNFFHKDSSSFFTPSASTTEPDSSSNSMEDDLNLDKSSARAPGAGELDIVGALGNLDLDEDFDNTAKKSTSTTASASTPVPNTTKEPAPGDLNQFPLLYSESSFQPQFYPYPHPHAGSVTPNPSHIGTFAAHNGSSAFAHTTPSTTWNSTFVPQTAPPFAYSSDHPENPLIPHFELPENTASKDSEKVPLNLPFSTPPPAQVNFGGILENFDQYPRVDKPEKDLDSFTESNFGFSGFDLVNPPKDPGMWNPMLSNQQVMRNTYVENRMNSLHHLNQMSMNYGQNHGQNMNSINNSNRYGGYRGRYNDSMNVHRKMHNNRRKGDDASKYANSKLEDFTGEIYNLCKDQHGCRFLQRQLDLGREVAEGRNNGEVLTNDIAATMIFNEIYLKIIELMTDPFGNYLIQKLFENVSSDQRLILVKNAAPEFIRIALDPHGTRALQKLVECITTEEESNLLIASLSPHIVSLSRDLNGNHVVQKCLQKLKSSENQFIFDAASVNCIEIATHRHGCCVLQRCLDHGNFSQRKQLSLKVAENATTLSLDPFGNYVVQYVLSRGDDESIKIILNHIQSNVVSLSLHKFGSNVIEKSLRISKLTDSLVAVLLKNEDRFGVMLNDAFGNYVLQTSLDVASTGDLVRLSNALQPLMPNIKNTPHGRRIMTKIQSLN